MEPSAKTATNKIVVPVRMTNNFRFSREHGSCHQKTIGFWGRYKQFEQLRSIVKCSSCFILNGSIQGLRA